MSYAYDTIADIIRLAEENNISFGDVVLRYELENYDRNEEAVVREIENRLDIFESSIQDGIAYAEKRLLVCRVVKRHSLMGKHLVL